ncbi:MAG: hypothetical protein GY847_31805 [Proteobacteria bacterium]|nr:hypothetical protein [Pseudomonadota bacterium]
MKGCVSQPISWLALEQYRLGDLSKVAQQEIQGHLDQCTTCKANLEHLDTDTRLLKPPSVLTLKKPRQYLLHSRPAIAASVAFAAAALLLIVFKWGLEEPKQYTIRPNRIAFKGGEFAMMIARERNGRVKENPTHFAPGDNFSLFVTHPLPEATNWDVVIWQGDDVFFPVSDRPPLPGGNLVPIPQAFRLTGFTPVTICLMIGDQIPNRSKLRQNLQKELPEATVCSQLKAQLAAPRSP